MEMKKLLVGALAALLEVSSAACWSLAPTAFSRADTSASSVPRSSAPDVPPNRAVESLSAASFASAVFQSLAFAAS